MNGVKTLRRATQSFTIIFNVRTHPSVNDAYRQRDLSAFVQVSSAAINIHIWIEWIVMENRELSMCDKMLTRNYANLEQVSTKMEVCEAVEEDIRKSCATRRLV
ncbi:TPA: hypothetical protein N0F65_001952 [Lagenidium giganteum]|uniref:Uncharacterized protein n=1 Tax=Lagenidium giganteum TaxID=4803 RepID=A0AAV2YSV5_9STRA|nr:TPA: hypothetical protein N0F65_001952 [Lagenidium giganteum]